MRGSTLLIIIYILITINAAYASHFRYGNIVWRIPDPDTAPATVEFKVSLSYDLNLFSVLPVVGTLLTPGTLDYGDNSNPEPFSIVVTLLDNVLNLLTGSFTVRHTFNINNNNNNNINNNIPINFTVTHSSGGRFAFLNNNANQLYNISTIVNLNQVVVNRRGARVLNSSPVTSMLPIVTAYYGESTTFRVPAFDRETASLSYSLSSAVEMGALDATQPPNLVINANTGIVTVPNSLAAGYWNTQIKVSDGSCYVVVDFLIFVTVKPITLPCLQNLLPSLSLDIYANVILQLNLQATINTGILLPAITSSLLPSNVTLTAGISGSASLSWTPQLKDVGVYAITFGCRMATGLLGITILNCPANCQNTITLNVLPPVCGPGSLTSSGCSCPSSGFDVLSNCSSCLPNYYGSNCTQCNCVYGNCSQGITGTGACSCFQGYRGARCDVLVKPCSFSVPGYVRQTINTTNSIINPTSTTLLITSTNTIVNLTTSLSLLSPKIDIMLLIETTPLLSVASLSLQASLAVTTFINNLNSLSLSNNNNNNNIYVGLSTFTAPTNCLLSLNINSRLSLSASVADLQTALNLYLTTGLALGCSYQPKSTQLGGLVAASASAGGWRSDSYKVIIVITDSPFGEGGIYGNRNITKQALLLLNAVPIFITPTTLQGTYNSLVNEWGFGSTGVMLSSWANAYTAAFNSLKIAMNTIWPVVQMDPMNLVQNITSSFQLPPVPNTATIIAPIAVTVKNVNQTVTQLPDLVVNVVGWGVATITPQVNQAPTASIVTVTTREDIPTTIAINGNDADGDALNVTLETLPNKGILYISNTSNVLVRVNTSYSLPDGAAIPYFYYVPNLYYYGTDSFRFSLSDGCTKSSISNATIIISFFNYPPKVNGINTNTNENNNKTIQLVVSDVEDSVQNLVSIIRNLPDPKLGNLYHMNNNSLVQLNDQIASSSSHQVRFVPRLYVCCELATFSYQSRDTGNKSSDVAIVSIFINHVNQAPISVATNPVYVDRGIPALITIGAFDYDIADIETFTVTPISGGTLSDKNNNTITTNNNNNIGTAQISTSNTASLFVFFTIPSSSSNTASFKYSVTDSGNLISNILIMNIIPNPNQNPIATPIPQISIIFNSVSSSLSLSGTDPDPADIPSTLSIIITSIPISRGNLIINGITITNNMIGTSAATFSNGVSFTVSGNSNAGNDQFTFRVVDVLGAQSAVQTVNLRFVAVNRQPTASMADIYTQEDVEIINRITANDLDNDVLSVIIKVLPLKGKLKQMDGTIIDSVPTALTDSSYQFRFVSNPDDSGSPYSSFTFYVDDGTNTGNSKTSDINVQIFVTPVNDPPVASSTTVSIPEESPATPLSFTASDVDGDVVTVIILSLPSTSAGILTDMSGNAILVGASLSSPYQVKFTPTPLFVGTTSVLFKANDGTIDSVLPGTLTIDVTHVNLPPTSQVYLGTAVRLVSFPITLAAGDPNLGDSLSINITAYSALGEFSFPDSAKRGFFPSAPFVLPYTLTVPQSRVVSVVLNYLAPAGASGDAYASISFYVIDQTGLTSAVTTTYINIAPNNPPTVNAVGPISVNQDFMSTPFILSGSDIDIADVSSLQVIVLTLPSRGTLFYGNGTAITSAPLVLSSSSAATVTYLTTQRGTDYFTFTVQDNLLATALSATVSISINNTNHPPVAQWLGDSTGDEDTVVSITQMGASDPDADDTVFTYFIASRPTKGTLTQADGTACATYPCLVRASPPVMLFTPLKDGNGIPYATFNFFVRDPQGASSVGNTVATININPVNDPPMAYASNAIGDENTNITVTLNITDVDTPASGLSILIVSLPAASMGYLTTQSGVVIKVGDTVPLQNLIFVPVLYANGNTNFMFRASDGQSFSNSASCSIKVNNVNQVPICGLSIPSPIVVGRSTTTTFSLLATDPDTSETYTFTVTSFQQTAGASSSLTGPNGAITSSSKIGSVASSGMNTPLSLTYTTSGSIESLNFTFNINDGTATSGTCVVRLEMSDNIPPVADAPSSVTVPQETMSGSIAMTGSDPDDSRPVRVVILTLPQSGVLYVSSSNSITQPGTILNAGVYSATYQGNYLFYGSDSYTYAIVDANGMYSPVQTVPITVTHVNHAPTASAGVINGVEDTPLTITQIFANDVDGDALTLVLTGPPSSGSFTLMDGTPITSFDARIPDPFNFKYIPAQYANGPVTFSFYVTDGTANSSPITATINIAAVNNAPVAQSTSLTIQENAPTTSFTLSITDVDSPQQALVARITALPSSSLGYVSLPDGSTVSVGQFVPYPFDLTFTPSPYASGSATLSFVARDETLFSSNTGAVSITVNHVNHAPSVTAATPAVLVRGSELVIPLFATDMDVGDTVTFSLVSVSGGGSLATTSGGSAIAAGATIATSTVSSLGASLLANLYFNAPVSATGTNYATFTFIATDQVGSPSNQFTVVVSVTPNSPPTTNFASISVTQDQTSSAITLAGTDQDAADQGSLRVFVTVLPTKGILYQNGVAITSASTTTPVTNPITYSTTERGTDSFSFVVADNVGAFSPARSVPISITPVNHAPTLSYTGGTVSVKETTTAVITQISTFDKDGDTVTVYVGSLPGTGLGRLTQFDGTPITSANTAVTDANYRVIYYPAGAESANQATSFGIYASDNMGASNSNTSVETININIIHVNRPPVPANLVVAISAARTPLVPQITDADSLQSSLQIIIRSLPDASIGTLYTEITGSAVAVSVGDTINHPYSLYFVKGSGSGYTTFSFSATDGTDVSVNYGVFGLGVRPPGNSPPVASAPSSFTATRGVPLSIQLGAHDDDILETFTFHINAVSAGGVFSDGTNNLTPPSLSLVVNQDPNVYITNGILYFTAPVISSGSSYLEVSFTVDDSHGGTSNSVSLSVGIAPNNDPVAVPPPTINYKEDGNSSSFSLGGNDADVADANSLLINITSLPQKGTLFVVGGDAVVIGTLYPQNTQFFIVGTPLMFGDDSFNYNVVDNVGGISQPQKVSISITHINHPPSAYILLPNGIMNQPINIQIYGQDVDPNSFVTAYITELPTQGYLTQFDGTKIDSASPSNPIAVTNSAGKLIYYPPTNIFGNNIDSLSFYVSDNSNDPSTSTSPTQEAFITIARADLPPVSYNNNINVNDGSSVLLHLNVSDPQNYDLITTITSFPLSGSLFRSDGTQITPSSPNVGSDNVVVFVPLKGTYDQTFTFTYQASSPTSGLSSSQSTISAYVARVYSAPVFTGQTTYSIPENSEANLLFSATSESGFYSINIINTPAIGSFIFINGNNNNNVDITGIAPYLMNNSDSENRAKFTPPTNTSGSNLVTISLQVVDSHGVSEIVNVIISVYHVNIAPAIVPTTYKSKGETSNWTTTVSILENNCVVVDWDISDVDSDRANLTSFITSLPFRGKLYLYDEQNVNGQFYGNFIENQILVNRSLDGFFHVIYCPENGRSGNNFASFSVIASDNIAISDRRYVNMRVIHVNAAPTVNVTQNLWNNTINAETLITGVSVNDIDAKIFAVKFVLSLSFSDGNQITNQPMNATSLGLFQSTQDEADVITKHCNFTFVNVTCVATVDKLNVMLNQIALPGYASVGNVTLTIFVDDLGNGNLADSKNATDYVTIEILPADTSRRAGNNNVLTAAVASAAVVGAAAAAGVYGYMRKRSPPTSTFFGLEHGLANGAINENPLYEGGIVMENSLYRAPTFGMQKL